MAGTPRKNWRNRWNKGVECGWGWGNCGGGGGFLGVHQGRIPGSSGVYRYRYYRYTVAYKLLAGRSYYFTRGILNGHVHTLCVCSSDAYIRDERHMRHKGYPMIFYL